MAAASSADAENVDDGIPIPTIQNVVSTVHLDSKLDLEAIASSRVGNAEYKRNCNIDQVANLIGIVEARFIRLVTTRNRTKPFAFVTMSIREPKTTALIFANGKVIFTGATSEVESKLAARKYVRIIQKLGFPAAKFKDFRIVNVLGICNVNFRIWVEGLADSNGDLSRHKPEEIREVAIYHMKKAANKKFKFMIYPSGKIVIGGAKSKEEIYTAFQKIYPMVTVCRKFSGMDCCDQLSKMSIVECKAESDEDFCDQLSSLSFSAV